MQRQRTLARCPCPHPSSDREMHGHQSPFEDQGGPRGQEDQHTCFSVSACEWTSLHACEGAEGLWAWTSSRVTPGASGERSLCAGQWVLPQLRLRGVFF